MSGRNHVWEETSFDNEHYNKRGSTFREEKRGACRGRSCASTELWSDPFVLHKVNYCDVEQPVQGVYRVKAFDARNNSFRSNNNFELYTINPTRNHPCDNSVPASAPREAAMGLPLLARQFFAEFLGTFVLVLIGDGSIAQYLMLEKSNNNFVTVALGYGLGLSMGILVSGGVSGGHLNPAVTLAMATLKKCDWLCVPVYWAAQYLGALAAASVLFGVYADGIFENLGGKNVGSAGIFASFPNPQVSTATLIMDQTLGTALLLIFILAVTDKNNMEVPSGLVALLIGLGLTAIHLSLAFNAGCAINPARDFSPRLLTLIAGFGSEVFTTAKSFFWIPWVMPHVGAVVGALVYYFMIEMHHTDF